jgi:integrase
VAKIKKTKLKLISNLESFQVKNINNWISPFDTDDNVDWIKTTHWKVTSEGQRGFVILRYVKLKNKEEKVKERFDRSLYDFQKNDEDKCEEVCRVLNYRLKSKLEARRAWIIKSDFIKVQGSELSKSFKDYMLARSANEKHARKCVRLVEMHFLTYFYYERSTPLFDYLEWHSPKIQAEYIEYLLMKDSNSKRFGQPMPLAVKTIKALIQYINHFFKFLHMESDGRIPDLKFTFPSITNTRFVDHTAKRVAKLVGDSNPVPRSKQYIDEDTFERIYVTAPEDIKSSIWIAYKYGLRRSEVLGLEQADVKKTHLKLIVQLIALKTERDEEGYRVRIVSKTKGPLKNRDAAGRKIPHWYAEPGELYEHISKMKVIHPSGLTEKWTELMREMKLGFEFKHLRNAFCSNALRDQNKFKISASDVQLAMGHSDQRTTMIYLRDFRSLADDEESWTPEVG